MRAFFAVNVAWTMTAILLLPAKFMDAQAGVLSAPLSGAPPLTGLVDFRDTPQGASIVVDPARYAAEGVILGCTPGHHLYTVERDGPDGSYDRSLAVSVGGSDTLFISITFVDPATGLPGMVQATDIQALDAGHLGYRYEYQDSQGGPANNGSNSGDYRIGNGWYYSEPVAHTFVFRPGDGQSQYLDNIRFSTIQPVTATATREFTWGQVKSIYRK